MRDNSADKTIASARNGFNVAGTIRVVAECDPHLAHDRIEAHVEGDRVGGPQQGDQLVASDELARPAEQGDQHLERLVLETHLCVAAQQFTGRRHERPVIEGDTGHL